MRHGSRRGIRHGNPGRHERARQPAAPVQEHGDRFHKAVARYGLFLVMIVKAAPSLAMSSMLLMRSSSQDCCKVRVSFSSAISSLDVLFVVDAINFTRLPHGACRYKSHVFLAMSSKTKRNTPLIPAPGDVTAVAELSEEQLAAVRDQEKGEANVQVP